MQAFNICSEKFNLPSIIIPSTLILSILDIIVLLAGIINRQFVFIIIFEQFMINANSLIRFGL